MSSFFGSKALMLGGSVLFAATVISPQGTTKAINLMKTAGMQSRPGLLKKTRSGETASTGTSTPTTTTTNTTTAAFPESSIIPSNFDITSELIDAPIPGQDNVVEGAFRFICNAGQLRADDPIVYPGQPGRSHLHQFYGNTAADAYSTYDSLRKTGQSTCQSPLNRSAYWMPAMLDGKGNVVRPDWISIYYKRRPSSDPALKAWKAAPSPEKAMGIGVPLPNGLRFVFGWDPTGKNSAKTGEAWFNCDGPTAKPGHYWTIGEAMANCPAGNRIGAVILAPDCWDGKNIDSPDHRSHVAYADYSNGYGYLQCPATHPYVIPQFTLGAWYTIAPGDEPSKWRFSSDDMAPDRPAGYTFHADWFGAWDNTVMSMWMDNCIDKVLSCSSGNLGNGKQMRMFSGFSFTANPRLVPVPQ